VCHFFIVLFPFHAQTLTRTCPDVFQLHLVKRTTFPRLDGLGSSDHHELPLVLQHITHPDLVPIDHGKVPLGLVQDGDDWERGGGLPGSDRGQEGTARGGPRSTAAGTQDVHGCGSQRPVSRGMLLLV